MAINSAVTLCDQPKLINALQNLVLPANTPQRKWFSFCLGDLAHDKIFVLFQRKGPLPLSIIRDKFLMTLLEPAHALEPFNESVYHGATLLNKEIRSVKSSHIRIFSTTFYAMAGRMDGIL